MPWQDAVQAAGDHAVLLLETRPDAQVDRFPDGFDPWRGRIGVRVAAPAADGRANDAVRGVVAAVLGVPPRAVELVEGPRSRRKACRVPLRRDEVLARLEAFL